PAGGTPASYPAGEKPHSIKGPPLSPPLLSLPPPPPPPPPAAPSLLPLLRVIPPRNGPP
ncbi:hypothetical protein IWX92DRAFT_310246, partial [Phyllosticta citricarpa]